MIPPALSVPDQSAALKTEAEQTHPLVASLRALTITTPEARATVNELLFVTKTRAKAIEDERTSVTKPLNAVLRTVNGWFKPLSGVLGEVETLCKQKLWDYDRLIEAQQRAQLQAASEAYKAGQVEAATEALAAIPDKPITAGTSIGTSRVLRVVCADLVPREYCSPDAALLGRVPAGVEVPGCVWEDVANVRVRI